MIARPPWIEGNLELHQKFCTDIPKEDSLDRIKIPKNRKRRAASRAFDDDPFCTLIQKMMFAFGDFDCVSNHLTAKEIETYIKERWVKRLQQADSKELNETFVNKIYQPEIQAFKKIKNIMKDVDDFQNKEVEYDISFIPKEDLDENLYNDASAADGEENAVIDEEEKGSEGEEEINVEEENPTENMAKGTSDNLHEERTSFYSSLAEAMDEVQYDVFSKSRLQNFLSRGKEAFLEWIDAQCSKFFIDYFAHLAYHEVRLIVEYSNRRIGNDQLLKKLDNPLTLEQIRQSIEQRDNEIETAVHKINELKGEKLFIKEYVNYYDYKNFPLQPCKP